MGLRLAFVGVVDLSNYERSESAPVARLRKLVHDVVLAAPVWRIALNNMRVLESYRNESGGFRMRFFGRFAENHLSGPDSVAKFCAY